MGYDRCYAFVYAFQTKLINNLPNLFPWMYYYIAPFLAYVLTLPLVKYGPFLIARIVLLLSLLFAFRKSYKFKLKLDTLSIFIGALIFLVWVMLEGFYPLLGESSYAPPNQLLMWARVFSFVAITPLIEEFFTRNFLARILVSNKWKKVRLGKFTPVSFILITLFFAFSHNRWLPGLVAGILLNYLIFKKKSMSSVIVAHTTANLLLAIYIVYTQSWFFW